jgi:hypothetical protein
MDGLAVVVFLLSLLSLVLTLWQIALATVVHHHHRWEGLTAAMWDFGEKGMDGEGKIVSQRGSR